MQGDRKALMTLHDVVEETRDAERRVWLAGVVAVVTTVYDERDRWAARIKELEARIERAVTSLRGLDSPPRVHGGIGARCSRCGGSNVHVHIWINPNTSELGEYAYEEESLAVERGASFCDDCKDHLPMRWDVG